MEYQQNISKSGIALVVLEARSTRLPDLIPLVPALMTGEYLAERAARGSHKKFDRVLKKIRAAKRAPEPADER